jgi:hypothetical protein
VNNRETFRRSPDHCDPEGENEKRHHQRHTDYFHGRSVIAAGRRGRFSRRDRGGCGLTHIYTITVRADNKGLGDTEAFAACLQQSLISASC